MFNCRFSSDSNFCIAFIYKFAAAVLQPVGGGAIIQCLDIIGRSIIYVFACLAIVSFMFFLVSQLLLLREHYTYDAVGGEGYAICYRVD